VLGPVRGLLNNLGRLRGPDPSPVPNVMFGVTHRLAGGGLGGAEPTTINLAG